MRTEEEYQKLQQQKDELQRQYKLEIISSHEREQRAKQTRWEMMMEYNRLEKSHEKLKEDFAQLLKLWRNRVAD